MARLKLQKGLFFSPMGIFIGYTLAAAAAVLGFRFLFPAEGPPLPVFSLSWRLTRGVLEYINLFPALAMAALVIPFGMKRDGQDQFAGFSPYFLEAIKWPIISAICAVALYGLLCFLAYPLAWDKEAEMRFRGQLFTESREKARDHAAEGDWTEAAQFIAVCERIWPNSPELESLRQNVSIALEEVRFNHPEDPASPAPASGGPEVWSPPAWEPVDAAEALRQGEAAYQEERYYEAHWYATVAGRLARPGTVEATEAARAAGRAWNAVVSLEPQGREVEARRLYQLKNSGYEAMNAEDWIRGYYIFKDLSGLTPADPDVANFLGICEEEVRGIAFFNDELELTLGETLTGAVFSIPRRTAAENPDGRHVLRIGSLSAYGDYSYGLDIELLVFDREGELLGRMEAPYAKILPKTLGSQRRTVLLLRALDRLDRNQRWEPVWAGSGRSELGDTQILLDLPYEDFLLMSRVRRGMDNFLIGDLFTAERTLGAYGYIPQVFQAEILHRLAEPVGFLPVMILVLIVGWRYRARRRMRYLGIPMLILLPLVFQGIIYMYRSAMNTLGIWMALALGMTASLIVLFAASLGLFILALIFLSAQHS